MTSFGSWTCDACTYENEPHLQSCVMCNTHKKEDVPEPHDIVTNQTCGGKAMAIKRTESSQSLTIHDLIMPSPQDEKIHNRPEVSIKEKRMSFGNWDDIKNEKWTCSHCTFKNSNPLYLVCEVCGQEREKEVRDESTMFLDSLNDVFQSRCHPGRSNSENQMMKERFEELINYHEDLYNKTKILNSSTTHDDAADDNIDTKLEYSEIQEQKHNLDKLQNTLYQLHDMNESLNGIDAELKEYDGWNSEAGDWKAGVDFQRQYILQDELIKKWNEECLSRQKKLKGVEESHGKHYAFKGP